LLDKSIFDFLKENDFNPFPYRQIRDFAHQLLRAVAFLHDDLRLIHTDLKPENLMLVNSHSSHNNVSKVCFYFATEERTEWSRAIWPDSDTQMILKLI
jgi:serine/threonine protein kinase